MESDSRFYHPASSQNILLHLNDSHGVVCYSVQRRGPFGDPEETVVVSPSPAITPLDAIQRALALAASMGLEVPLWTDWPT